MGEMRIRIEDDHLLTRISDLAQLNNRSVDQEVESLLRAALFEPPRREDLRAVAERIAAMTPKGVKQTDSVEILREIRGN
ncbi:FitA-like ribbon-helix-helix domain-containing protein [Rhizobium sp.]